MSETNEAFRSPAPPPDTFVARWEEVGSIGVDAGIVWLGDPCYILHRNDPAEQDSAPADIGVSWHDFCERINARGIYRTGVAAFSHDAGYSGMGLCVSTAYGDGEYPVYVKRNRFGRIAEVKIVFAGMDDPDEAV